MSYNLGSETNKISELHQTQVIADNSNLMQLP